MRAAIERAERLLRPGPALVVTARSTGFGDALARQLGVPAERVASPSDDLAHAHTAFPAVALEPVGLAAARTTLFVSVGAGITAAAAL